MIRMFSPTRIILLLLLPETSDSQGSLQARQAPRLLLQDDDRWPGVSAKPYRNVKSYLLGEGATGLGGAPRRQGRRGRQALYTLTGISFTRACSLFGMVISRTPSLSWAVAFSPCTPAGRGTVREKAP